MRKLIAQQWVTVDNIAAEEDGGLSFVSGEPFDDAVTDNPFQNSLMGFIDSVDTMILGANTYRQTHGYWPTADEQAGTARSSTASPCTSPPRHWITPPGATTPPRP